MLKIVLAAAIGFVLVTGPQESAKKQDDPLADVKCFMMPTKPIKKDVTSDYHDAKVYFCCKKCKGNFDKEPAKYEAMANKQLVETKQFVQKGCPIGGGKTDGTHVGKIGEMEVSFCCEKCLAKFNGAADDDAKVAMVFSADGFMKGFKMADAEGDKQAEKGSK